MDNAESIYENRIGFRLLAFVLAVVIFFNLFLAIEAQIRFSERQFLGKIAEYAASVTEDNTKYLSKGNLDRAWDVLKTLVRKPRTYDDYDLYASIAIAREDYGNAVQYMQGCIDTYDGGNDKDLAVLYLRQASLYVLTEEYEKAVEYLDKAEELDESLSATYFMRAEMKMVLGDMEGATEDVNRYIELDGGDPVIMASLGQLYESTGDPAKAAECYAIATETDAHAYVDRARCLIMTGDFDKAKRCLEIFRGFSSDDQGGEVSAMLGVCLMNDEEYPEAANEFRTAVEHGYATPHLMHEQAMMCSYIAGDYETAIKDGLKAVETKKATGEAIASTETIIGLCNLVIGQYAEAETHFQAATDDDPDLADMRYYLALCAMSLEEYDRAADLYTESISRKEDVTACLYNRAVCRLNLDDVNGAKEDFAAVIERNDDAELTVQAQEALEALNKINESD